MTRSAESVRVPPHSIEAEQSLLGGLLLDGRAWDEVADVVIEEDFYRNDHRLIFSAIRNLSSEGTPVDAVTVGEYLSRHAKLDEIGGMAYLGDLVSSTSGASNIKSYAQIIRERSILRQLVRIGTDIGNFAFNTEGRTSAEILDIAEQKVFDIAEQGARGNKGYRRVRDLLGDVAERIDRLYHSDSSSGLPTGFTDLDLKTSGLQPSDLVIIAGRPSMGKTSFVMNLVEHAAIKSRQAVAVFSLEMSAEQLILRMLSSLGRIDQHRVRTGKLNDEDWPRLTSAMSLLEDSPIYIDDTPALSPSELRARARRIKREHGDLGLIVIDYLQLMQNPGSENRTNEISEISRSLKALAKELHVPVLALSQLNRGLEQRTNKRPIMSDLRESGAIEQDADLIAFIYRDEVYNEDSPDKGIAEIIIGKQRNGPIGTVRLTFLGQFTRFENYVGDSYDSEAYA
ncbi:MAG: replicative DNA helicase [Gammaproteobacteria bacterium]|nr:replicative DNA helicase [Gammaproteobacteria bacterium]